MKNDKLFIGVSASVIGILVGSLVTMQVLIHMGLVK